MAEYGVGRNTSAGWAPDEDRVVRSAFTDFLPTAEVERVEPNEAIDDVEFGMEALAALAEAGPAALRQGLRGLVQVPTSIPGADHCWGLYSILLPDGTDRGRVQDVLKSHGVPSGIYYPKPLHHQPAYAGAHAGSVVSGSLTDPPPLLVSEMLCGRILSLPLHPYLTEEEAQRVVVALRSRSGQPRRSEPPGAPAGRSSA